MTNNMVKNEITPTELKEEISRLRIEYNEVRQKLLDKINSCSHEAIKKYVNCETASCNICGKILGWYCSESPKKYCEYAEDDRFKDECIYCGDPEERK